MRRYYHIIIIIIIILAGSLTASHLSERRRPRTDAHYIFWPTVLMRAQVGSGSIRVTVIELFGPIKARRWRRQPKIDLLDPF